MALVKCPECGRENVSDSAEMCPECGYNVKGHFQRIKQEEEEKRKRREFEEKLAQQAIEKEKQEKAELSQIRMPPPPTIHHFLIPFIPFTIWGVVMYFMRPNELGLIMGLFVFIVGIAMGISFYKSTKKDYQKALANFEEYQRDKLKEEKEIKRQHEIERQRKNTAVKCPYCGSYNTSKIGTISRSVSVGVLGLASNKIGKQRHCKDCGSDF